MYGTVGLEIVFGISALLEIVGPVVNKTQSPVQLPGVLLAVIATAAVPAVP